jgi:hypothetical protein
MPIQMRALRDGLEITFTNPLDPSSAMDEGNWTANRWQYRRTQNYGSEDYRPGEPPRRGRERMQVETVELADDERTVRIKFRDMQPAMQMEVRYKIRAADGTELSQLIHHTVHTLEAPVPDETDVGLHQRLQPGLLLELSQLRGGIRRDVRTARLPAILVPADEPPSPFLDPGRFTARFRGYLSPELSGSYTFHLAGRGTATLRINGEVILRGQGDLAKAGTGLADIRNDYTPIEIAYESAKSGAGELRLYWEGRSADCRSRDAASPSPRPRAVRQAELHSVPFAVGRLARAPAADARTFPGEPGSFRGREPIDAAMARALDRRSRIAS